jgi:hypothetical protein
VELGSEDASFVQVVTKLLEAMLISNGTVNERWVMVSRATKCVSVFEGSMTCLNSLLREGEISTRDGIKECRFYNLRIHDASLVGESIYMYDGLIITQLPNLCKDLCTSELEGIK